MVKKRFFENDVIKHRFIKILIYTDLWEINDIFNMISKNIIFLDFLKIISKQQSFSQNVNIYGFMDKNDFFKVLLKLRNFLRYVDIFGYKGNKRLLQRDLKIKLFASIRCFYIVILYIFLFLNFSVFILLYFYILIF